MTVLTVMSPRDCGTKLEACNDQFEMVGRHDRTPDVARVVR